MSDPVAEISILSLVPGTDLRAGEAKQTWLQTLQTIAKQDGCTGVRWGMQIENKDTAQVVAGKYLPPSLPLHPLPVL
jgi:hypothetical protein